jgi:hypothetical protein
VEDRPAEELISTALHELRGGVGAISLSVTSVLEDGDDPTYRADLLGIAVAETRRLDAGLAALGALALALADHDPMAALPSDDLLSEAAQRAARRRARCEVRPGDHLPLRARPRTAAAVVAALVELVAVDADGHVEVSARTQPDGRSSICVRRADGAPTRVDALVEALGAAAGFELHREGDTLIAVPMSSDAR